MGSKSPSPPPPAPAPVVMPTPDTASITAAKQAQQAAAMARSGRMSTIMSQGNGTGGSDKLGS